jgi:PLP dependent protein
MNTISQRLYAIRTEINTLETAANRPQNTVLLLAVSKTKPASDIALAYQAGQRHFGENYCQEALKKQQHLGAFNISWHFIGPIQSNKTKDIAAHFNWVHSVDNLKIAQRLNDQRPDNLPPLNVCVQVNISKEETKSGLALAALPDICAAIALLPRLKLRGVMAIPAPQEYFEDQRKPYQQLRVAVAKLNGLALDTFSFGMSGDLKAAIFEGATIVRLGSALFGSRG